MEAPNAGGKGRGRPASAGDFWHRFPPSGPPRLTKVFGVAQKENLVNDKFLWAFCGAQTFGSQDPPAPATPPQCEHRAGGWVRMPIR